jgi:radical SAM protein with 4Fe4S-binding SPASM domain
MVTEKKVKAKLISRSKWSGIPRADLCKVLPLDTPFHLFIDPSAACNFSCNFCFNSDKKRAHHEIMHMDLFNKIADDITQFPKRLKAIKLYGFGEPLMNHNLEDMVALLKISDVSERVETTTNGWWLTPDRADKLIDSEIDRIVISVNGLSSSQFEDVAKARVKFYDYVKNLQYLYDHKGSCIIHIKTTNVTADFQEDVFFNTFGDICDEIAIENIGPLWPNMKSDAHPNKNFFGGEIIPIEICPYIFYHMTVQANGQVSSCFVDWERKNIIGDVHYKPLAAIWKGSQLKHLRGDHLLGQRYKHEICKDCKQLIYGQADNIDRCAIDIYERMML